MIDTGRKKNLVTNLMQNSTWNRDKKNINYWKHYFTFSDKATPSSIKSCLYFGDQFLINFKELATETVTKFGF